MRPHTRWLVAPLLVVICVAEAPGATPRSGASHEVSGSPVQASISITGQPDSNPSRLRLVTHTGSLRALPPYSSSISPFDVPWPHHADQFGLAGAFDLWQSSRWRFGVQAEGIYTRHGLPFYVPGINRWRRRIVIYGTYEGDRWTVSIGVVVNDTGAQRRLPHVLAANNRGARRDCVSRLANRKAGRAIAIRTNGSARDMRKVRPQDDVIDRPRKGSRRSNTPVDLPTRIGGRRKAGALAGSLARKAAGAIKRGKTRGASEGETLARSAHPGVQRGAADRRFGKTRSSWRR
jgi:hypothetical protein